MLLKQLILQNFRSYTQKQFYFSEGLNIVVGPNTAGKTNLCEAIILLSTGKSFRADKDIEMIRFGEEIGRVTGMVEDNVNLETTLAQGQSTRGRFLKKFTVNGVGRSRYKFVGYMPTVLFRPEELEIITQGPSLRRDFLDSALEQVDTTYRIAKLQYDKALRQRNALLYLVREAISRNAGGRERYAEQFTYWDKLLIEQGNIITQKREGFLEYVENFKKDIFLFSVFYDKSIISTDRLWKYKDAEIHAGVTLVGPQRDDIKFFLSNSIEQKNAKLFGSRGQERLIILQLKLIQLQFMKNISGVTPIFVLDDIFSELDSRNISLVLDKLKTSQLIITTTHGEFVKNIEGKGSMIKL